MRWLYDGMWHATFVMGGLFREAAREVAGYFGYSYPERDDGAISRYLRHMRGLPGGAKDI